MKSPGYAPDEKDVSRMEENEFCSGLIIKIGENLVTNRTQGNRVDLVEPQRNKRESTPLPPTRDAASTVPGGGRQ